MSRGLWFVAGAGAGIYASLRAKRAAEALTADGVRDRVRALGVGAQIVRDEVVVGRTEKEIELRDQLGLATPGNQQLARSTKRQQLSSQERTDGHI